MCNKQQMIDVMVKHGFTNIKTYEEARFKKNYIAIYGDCPCGLGTSAFCIEYTACEPHEPIVFERMVQAHIEHDRAEGRWK